MNKPETKKNKQGPINDGLLRRILLVYTLVLLALAISILFGEPGLHSVAHTSLIVFVFVSVFSISAYGFLQRRNNVENWMEYVELPRTRKLIFAVSLGFGASVASLILLSRWDNGEGELTLANIASSLGLGVFHVIMYFNALKRRPRNKKKRADQKKDEG
jgi:hypothetical protein